MTRQGWTVAREYCDYESGSKGDRTEFQQMFADASKCRFDLLLFWVLGRLSRERALKTLQHLDTLEGYGVNFRSFTEPYFDACGIFKEAVFHVAQERQPGRAIGVLSRLVVMSENPANPVFVDWDVL